MPGTSGDSDVEIVSRRVAPSQPPSVLRRASLPTSSGANPNRPRPAPHSSQDAEAPAAARSPAVRKQTYKAGAWAQSKPSSAASTSGASGTSGSRRAEDAGQATPPSISAKGKELLARAKARLPSLADPKGKGKAAETVVLSSDEELLPIPSASSPRAAFLPRAELTSARHVQQRKGPRASLPSAPSKGSTSQLAQPRRHSLAARPRDPAPLQETAAVGDTSSESDPLRVHPVPPPSKARQKDGDPSRSSQTRSTSSSIAQLKQDQPGGSRPPDPSPSTPRLAKPSPLVSSSSHPPRQIKPSPTSGSRLPAALRKETESPGSAPRQSVPPLRVDTTFGKSRGSDPVASRSRHSLSSTAMGPAQTAMSDPRGPSQSAGASPEARSQPPQTTAKDRSPAGLIRLEGKRATASPAPSSSSSSSSQIPAAHAPPAAATTARGPATSAEVTRTPSGSAGSRPGATGPLRSRLPESLLRDGSPAGLVRSEGDRAPASPARPPGPSASPSSAPAVRALPTGARTVSGPATTAEVKGTPSGSTGSRRVATAAPTPDPDPDYDSDSDIEIVSSGCRPAPAPQFVPEHKSANQSTGKGRDRAGTEQEARGSVSDTPMQDVHDSDFANKADRAPAAGMTTFAAASTIGSEGADEPMRPRTSVLVNEAGERPAAPDNTPQKADERSGASADVMTGGARLRLDVEALLQDTRRLGIESPSTPDVSPPAASTSVPAKERPPASAYAAGTASSRETVDRARRAASLTSPASGMIAMEVETRSDNDSASDPIVTAIPASRERPAPSGSDAPKRTHKRQQKGTGRKSTGGRPPQRQKQRQRQRQVEEAQSRKDAMEAAAQETRRDDDRSLTETRLARSFETGDKDRSASLPTEPETQVIPESQFAAEGMTEDVAGETRPVAEETSRAVDRASGAADAIQTSDGSGAAVPGTKSAKKRRRSHGPARKSYGRPRPAHVPRIVSSDSSTWEEESDSADADAAPAGVGPSPPAGANNGARTRTEVLLLSATPEPAAEAMVARLPLVGEQGNRGEEPFIPPAIASPTPPPEGDIESAQPPLGSPARRPCDARRSPPVPTRFDSNTSANSELSSLWSASEDEIPPPRRRQRQRHFEPTRQSHGIAPRQADADMVVTAAPTAPAPKKDVDPRLRRAAARQKSFARKVPTMSASSGDDRTPAGSRKDQLARKFTGPSRTRSRGASLSDDPLALTGFGANLAGPVLPKKRRRARSPEDLTSRPSRATGNREELEKSQKRDTKRARQDAPAATSDLVESIRDSHAPLVLASADVYGDDASQYELSERFKRSEMLKQPWQRQITGPSYDFGDEFSTAIQDAVNRREARWARLHPDELPIRSEYRVLFEEMILESLSQEYAEGKGRPTIRVYPPEDAPPEAMSCPPFDFIYTNRVVYDDDIVPVQARGCGCDGDCNSPKNRATCSCLARQIKACATKEGGTDRSNHQGFAYDRQGRLHPSIFDAHDQIIECNSLCGCGPACINRVVGNRKSVSVDIFWTGIAGWGVRLATHQQDGTKQRTIRRGEPLAVYAGELLRVKDAYEREDQVYSIIGRNYIYELDAWTVLEDIKDLLPASRIADFEPTSSAAESHAKSTHKTSGKKVSAATSQPATGAPPGEEPSVSALYAIDAFSLGNWTRFCNHVCSGFNAMTRPVFIDEADVSRPLFVYFARRDIQPGEEITITYFGGEDDPSPSALGYSEAEWKRHADRAREKAPKDHRCYCGKTPCRGRMFDVSGADMFWEVPAAS